MSSFNKHETTTVPNAAYDGDPEDGVAAIYVHRETGLVVGVSVDQEIFDGSWIDARQRQEMDILKHVWVEAWYGGETVSYWVTDLDDIPQLEELLKETHVSSINIAVSRDFVLAAIDEL